MMMQQQAEQYAAASNGTKEGTQHPQQENLYNPQQDHQ